MRLGPDAREIGYWIRADAEGHGYVTEAVAALTRVGFELDDVEWVEIRCDPANERSAAVPRRLGYRHEATLRGRLAYPETRDAMIFALFADEYPRSPAASAALEAYDAAGARLL